MTVKPHVALAVLSALAIMPGVQEYAAAESAAAQDTPIVESIYNFHTVRVSRTAPTAFCDATGWPVLFEDLFDVYSYATRGVDGRVVQTARQKVGTVRACFGIKTLSPLVLNFDAEFEIGELLLVGTGVCTQQFANFPVAGAGFYYCIQSLSSAGYLGGQLVTSSATGPAPIEESDPNVLGVHEASFATVRLWRAAP